LRPDKNTILFLLPDKQRGDRNNGHFSVTYTKYVCEHEANKHDFYFRISNPNYNTDKRCCKNSRFFMFQREKIEQREENKCSSSEFDFVLGSINKIIQVRLNYHRRTIKTIFLNLAESHLSDCEIIAVCRRKCDDNYKTSNVFTPGHSLIAQLVIFLINANRAGEQGDLYL